tara:strand:- start:54 stop:716 length:663 start_codon:yes stop_codon:yes gene_type:complete
MTYDIDIYDNHLILISNNCRYLIDTGSPVTISNSEKIEIFNTNYKTSTNYLGLTVEGLSKSLGTNIDALIGGDVLKNHIFKIDYKNKLFIILDEINTNNESIDIDLFMGIPIIEIEINGNRIRTFLDTGAKISYINSTYVENLKPIDNRQDFYPTVGDFETDIYEFPIIFNDSKIDLTFGVLPTQLEQTLSFGNTKGIIGNDIFLYYCMIFDYKNKKIYY